MIVGSVVVVATVIGLILGLKHVESDLYFIGVVGLGLVVSTFYLPLVGVEPGGVPFAAIMSAGAFFVGVHAGAHVASSDPRRHEARR